MKKRRQQSEEETPSEKEVETKQQPEPETAEEETQKSFSSRVLEEGSVAQSSTQARKKLMKRFRKAKSIPSENDVERFTPTPDEGLSTSQVETRFNQFLFNDVNRKYSKSYRSIFIGNICTVFNLLCLLVAVALVFANAPISQYMFVVIFSANLFIGILQECLAKKQIDKLSVLVSATVRVVRDGQKCEVPIKEIVLDEIILLETGQQIPADCILIDGNVEVNESLLTGESVPVKKEKDDVLYAGSFISSGSCRVRADKVGKATYLNKLTSKAKQYKKPKSEVMNSIRLFIRVIGALIPLVAAGIFWVNFKANPLDLAIQYTAGVIIGMIPSGLLLLTSLAMALGVIRLAKKNTLVQDLYSLEMLARVNVLCLDKTGTITDGRMTVNDFMILNNYTELSLDEIMGNFLSATDDNNQTAIALNNRFGRASTLKAKTVIPFSSKRKLSAVTFEEAGTFVMGAPEFVLRPVPLKIEKIVQQYAQSGLRVLMLAYSPNPISGNKIPALLRPMAIITLADNIRSDAIETIKWFRENDVDIRIISGDNPVTVSEVARRVGVQNASRYISLDGLTDPEVENVASQYTVFGRVTPEQKAILVKAIKKQGNTVAMTGDGVNDILALKEADCAISVASGSEAARNVSHIVLTDNNFLNLPNVVNEGRRVINNIKSSASLYIMKTLFTTVLAVICFFLNLSPNPNAATGYFFKTNNMMIFEMLIAALPSFVIALQPNTERVKGKFILYVLSRSIPAALTLVACVMAVYVGALFMPEALGPLKETFLIKGQETEEMNALFTLAVTCGGLVMLFRIMQPFNVLRATTYAISVAITIAIFCIPVIGNIVYDAWSIVKPNFNLTQILYLIVIILAAFPLSSALLRICDLMNPPE